MSRQPEDDFDIGPVPTVSNMVREEAPWVVVVLIREQNAYTIITLGDRIVIVSPDNTKIERSSRSHDGDVWKRPSSVVVGQ